MTKTAANSRLGNLVEKAISLSPTGMAHLFDQFFHNDVNAPAPFGRMWFAAASFWEDADYYHLELDLPGVDKSDVELTVEKRQLLVSAERKAPQEERKYWHQERGYGKVERVVPLPDTVDTEKIEAELANGVLHIRLAKKMEAQPKRIAVKTS